MSIKMRREREKDEMRKLILEAANEIIKEEGMSKLSVRKIAKKIDYSAPIVYHYFKNKEDIINTIMRKGYKNILKELVSSQDTCKDPKENLEKGIRKYINISLETSEEYKSILLNSSKEVLEHTAVLFKGASLQRTAVGMLCKCVKDIFESENRDTDDTIIELRAQVIWVSMFGLIIRLIVEKDIDENQKQILVDSLIDYVIRGI
ncbi:TetR/AcrR family transcriptional regulator [Haloimpatiens sp. FM7330]|uniref:TetR/AcrR family transcriptional regulator n=1 Tax=Haloimpatiens sp. FM7330 TaxID=3298610 RepID=UPI003624B6D4